MTADELERLAEERKRKNAALAELGYHSMSAAQHYANEQARLNAEHEREMNMRKRFQESHDAAVRRNPFAYAPQERERVLGGFEREAERREREKLAEMEMRGRIEAGATAAGENRAAAEHTADKNAEWHKFDSEVQERIAKQKGIDELARTNEEWAGKLGIQKEENAGATEVANINADSEETIEDRKQRGQLEIAKTQGAATVEAAKANAEAQRLRDVNKLDGAERNKMLQQIRKGMAGFDGKIDPNMEKKARELYGDDVVDEALGRKKQPEQTQKSASQTAIDMFSE